MFKNYQINQMFLLSPIWTSLNFESKKINTYLPRIQNKKRKQILKVMRKIIDHPHAVISNIDQIITFKQTRPTYRSKTSNPISCLCKSSS